MKKTIYKIMEVIAAAALIVAAVIVVANILMGKITGVPLKGTYEMVGLCCSVMASMAIPMGTLMNSHISVDLFVQMTGKKTQKGLEYFAKVVDALVGCLLAYAAWLFSMKMLAAKETTANLSIPVWPFRFVWTLAGVLVMIFSIYNITQINKKYSGEVLSQAEAEIEEALASAEETLGLNKHEGGDEE